MTLIRHKTDAMQAVQNPLVAGMIAKRSQVKAMGRGDMRITMGAYHRLPASLRARIDAALEDACKRYACQRCDLVWSLRLYGKRQVPVISVKRREEIRI